MFINAERVDCLLKRARSLRHAGDGQRRCDRSHAVGPVATNRQEAHMPHASEWTWVHRAVALAKASRVHQSVVAGLALSSCAAAAACAWAVQRRVRLAAVAETRRRAAAFVLRHRRKPGVRSSERDAEPTHTFQHVEPCSAYAALFAPAEVVHYAATFLDVASLLSFSCATRSHYTTLKSQRVWQDMYLHHTWLSAGSVAQKATCYHCMFIARYTSREESLPRRRHRNRTRLLEQERGVQYTDRAADADVAEVLAAFEDDSCAARADSWRPLSRGNGSWHPSKKQECWRVHPARTRSRASSVGLPKYRGEEGKASVARSVASLHRMKAPAGIRAPRPRSSLRPASRTSRCSRDYECAPHLVACGRVRTFRAIPVSWAAST